MSDIVIVTDSNSGMTQEEAEKLGVVVLPMPFFINDNVHYEGIDLSQEEFFRLLAEDANVSTSQPSPGDVMDLWNKLLKEYDEIVYIPMSSGLSASCATALALAADFEGSVFVVDNKRISITQYQSVLDARALASAGYTGAQIKEILEKDALEASIYGRYLEISEEGRTCYSRRSHDRYRTESETCIDDPGGQAGCFCKSARSEAGKKSNAGSNEERYGNKICRTPEKRADEPYDFLYVRTG